MKRMKLRKTVLAAALVGATALGTTALVSAQPGGYGPGYGMGPGMMGPGMMGGYGPGCGMGPGMTGGYGPGQGGYGPGYGMGPGMVGPGMMGGGMGYGMLYQLNLTPDQWNKVNAIHEDLAKKQWDLTGKTREEALKLRNLMTAEKRDSHAVTNQYKKLQEPQLQSFQARVDALERIDGVLTKEQRGQLRRFAPWWGQHME
jgi:Spy/CpxP family protein refolding chaperone